LPNRRRNYRADANRYFDQKSDAPYFFTDGASERQVLLKALCCLHSNDRTRRDHQRAAETIKITRSCSRSADRKHPREIGIAGLFL
jgi:hypothetical protein